MSKVVVCNASPTSELHCIQDRADIVFFAGYEFDDEAATKHYFENAKAFFKEKYPGVMQHPADSLRDIIEALNTADRGDLPWGRIYICCHANTERWFMRSGTADAVEFPNDLQKLSHNTAFPQIYSVPQDGKDYPFSRVVIDPATIVIVKCCDLGKNRQMLFAIRQTFNGWPETRAPYFNLFLKKAGGVLTEQLFWELGPAMLPTKGRQPPFSSTERDVLMDGFARVYPHRSREAIQNLVNNGNMAWKDGTSVASWSKGYDRSQAIRYMINEDTHGRLYVAIEESKAPRGVPIDNGKLMLKTPGGARVPDSTIRKAFAEVFDIFVPKTPFKTWTASNWVVNRIEATETASKAYDVSVTLTGTQVYYWLLNTDSNGEPVVPDDDSTEHYGRSGMNTMDPNSFYVWWGNGTPPG